MAESTTGTLSNLETATTTYRGVMATFTDANSRLSKKLKERPNELKEVKALLKNERAKIKGREHSTILWKTSICPMDIMWQKVTQTIVVATLRTDTSLRPPRITVWE
jgi:hypothetical protein